jgi:hypothetical protein
MNRYNIPVYINSKITNKDCIEHYSSQIYLEFKFKYRDINYKDYGICLKIRNKL